MTWNPEEFAAVADVRELEIAVQRVDGSTMSWTPLWVVGVDDALYVRTRYRRATGWYGMALRTATAQIRAAGIVADVHIEDVGAGPPGLRRRVEDAYRYKYGGGSTGEMVGDDAAATTLRLDRV